MKQTKLIMGMPITVEIVGDEANATKSIAEVFDYFTSVDARFSTYKQTSEITKINHKLLAEKDYSPEMQEVLQLCAQTKQQTDGYFDIEHRGELDPSGLVKGWSIYNATKILDRNEHQNYYIDAGGDIQMAGKNIEGKQWVVGIRNPFNRDQNVKILSVTDLGVATSGTYIRGQHVYNPFGSGEKLEDIVSLTVIGPNIYEADRFATAAFAMQRQGIYFIENLPGFEAYMIDSQGQATFTTHFNDYVTGNAEHS